MPRSPWFQFYKDRAHSATYFEYFKVAYAPFLSEVMLFAAEPKGPILELGAGLGSTTAHLMKHYHGLREFHVLEKCPEMGVLLEQRFGSTVTYLRTCAMEFSSRRPYGLVHSHGLLEHFSPSEVTKIIGNHRGAAAQVHYVPGVLHGEPSFGDERLEPIEHWVDVTRPDAHFTFNDGKDYCLVYLRR